MSRPGETPIPGWVCDLPLSPRSHVAGICRAAKLLPPRCCFCLAPVAPGDLIACLEHRAVLLATPMPWEKED